MSSHTQNVGSKFDDVLAEAWLGFAAEDVK
jgi:hypothetical protein